MPANLDAITWILPGHRIQTEPLALVSGALAGSVLELLVPPAGWPIVMAEPEPALKFCLVQTGMAPDQAGAVAEEETRRLRRNLSVYQQPILMSERQEWRHGVPTAAVVGVLERIGPRGRAIGAGLMAGATKVSCAKRIMPEISDGIGPYSVADLVHGPVPEAWTEAFFLFGTAIEGEAFPARPFHQVPMFWKTDPDKRNRDDFKPAVLAWLTQTIEVAAEIARVIGRPVFDPPGWWGDVPYSYHGDVHRWLMLDFACYAMPASPFVERLIRASGARDVEDLRAALQAPSSYQRDFQLLDAFSSQLEVCSPIELDWEAFTSDQAIR